MSQELHNFLGNTTVVQEDLAKVVKGVFAYINARILLLVSCGCCLQKPPQPAHNHTVSYAGNVYAKHKKDTVLRPYPACDFLLPYAV
mgnify:CR=1 FL=1